MKIVVEFDPSNASDVRALQALLGQGTGLTTEFLPKTDAERLGSQMKDAKPAEPSTSITTMPLKEAGKEANEAANTLLSKLGTPQKMTTKERAKVAADARWSKKRAGAQAAQPVPETPRAADTKHPEKKNLKLDTPDCDEGTEVALSQFSEVDGEDIKDSRDRLPDVRSLLEENYDEPQNLDYTGFERSFVKDTYERARSYERG